MNQIDFLTKNSLECVRQIIANAEEAIIAVAYWGNCAMKELGLDMIDKERQKKFIIICDLMSGACNPDVIRELLGNDNKFVVRKCSSLHAKIYWTPGAVVIGSSNVSANGLGFEGAELSGLLEANALVTNEVFLDKCIDWLRLEVLPKSSQINPSDLALADNFWRPRRQNRQTLTRVLSLSELLKNPIELKDRPWYVWIIFDDKLSRQGDAMEEEAKNKLGSDVFVYELKERIEHHGEWVLGYWFLEGRLIRIPGGAAKFIDTKPARSVDTFYCHYAREVNDLSGIVVDPAALKTIENYLSTRADIGKGKKGDRISVSLHEIASSL